MQLGTRWAVGAEAPTRLPGAVRAAINQVEASVADTASRSWTLTWLEGMPVVALDQLSDDDATVIRYHRDTDTASINAGNPDDEWPSD